MELRNDFSVPGSPDHIFELLLDLEQVARCMPGATLTGHHGDDYEGTLKVKVGPIAAAYQGKVTIAEIDRAGRSATLRAAGREMNGQGGAEATIHATVGSDGNGSGSRVSVTTDVNIRGKAAQFGRGALADVTQRVIDQFAKNLEAQLLAGERPEPAVQEEAPPVAAATAAPSQDDSLDVLSVVALPVVKQAAPLIGTFLLGLLIGWLLGGRRRTGAAPPPWHYPGWPPAPPGGSPG